MRRRSTPRFFEIWVQARSKRGFLIWARQLLKTERVGLGCRRGNRTLGVRHGLMVDSWGVRLRSLRALAIPPG